MVRLQYRKKVLAIGGSDSSGGAGIQADVKSISSVGVHACVVVTCITSQNTLGVRSIFPIPVEMVREQFDAVMTDINPPVAKSGLLATKRIIEVVADRIAEYQPMYVLDPVMQATSGDKLVGKGYLGAMMERLLPLATIVTPNLLEASQMVGYKVANLKDMKAAASNIHDHGPMYVLVTGGHLEGPSAVDVLYNGAKKKYNIFKSKKIDRELHGTGCTMGALISAHLAKGKSVRVSVRMAKDIITQNIQYGYDIGQGKDVVDSHSHLFNSVDMYRTQEEVKSAVERLRTVLVTAVVPEVGINIGYALPHAHDNADICALKGRILRAGNTIMITGKPEFGASKHISRVLLAAMSFDHRMRACMNIAYSETVIDAAKLLTFSVHSFDREDEPDDSKSTMSWGTGQVIERTGMVPDLIFDLGGHGKEAMVRIIGNNPNEVVDKLERILDEAYPSV